MFKFEGGTHRVQRVPQTESQGRVHTSTATVAVLPEAEDVDIQVDPNDLQIDVYRSSGPGGQSVNTTDSAVRVTHKPSGIVVSMQDEKSQLQNREKALRVLRARLYERALAEQQAELAADRRSQVGTGDRAEKIRTYNYGERRVTDHRIKLTVHNLDQVLEGDLDEITSALQADEKRRRLEAKATEHLSGAASAQRSATARRCRDRRLARGAPGRHHGDRGGGLRNAPPGRRSAAGPRPRRRPRAAAERPLAAGARARPCGRSRSGAPPLHRARAGRLHRRAPRLQAARARGRPRARWCRGRRPSCSSRSAWALPEGACVLDLGTGSGAVALALKDERPDLDVWGSDVSAAALELARENARAPGARVGWLQADLLAGVPDRFDAILANPPYVAEGDALRSRRRSLRHEPMRRAAGRRRRPRGDPPAARPAAGARRACGLVALEVGAGQADAVAELMDEARLRTGPLRARPCGYKTSGDRGTEDDLDD